MRRQAFILVVDFCSTNLEMDLIIVILSRIPVQLPQWHHQRHHRRRLHRKHSLRSQQKPHPQGHHCLRQPPLPPQQLQQQPTALFSVPRLQLLLLGSVPGSEDCSFWQLCCFFVFSRYTDVTAQRQCIGVA